MFIFDYLAEISAAIALIAAVVSPWITAAINNRHEVKMERLRFNTQHRAEVIEKFIHCAGQAVSMQTIETLSAFGDSLGEAYIYLPEELHSDIEVLTEHILQHDKKFANETFTRICKELRKADIRPLI